MMVDPWDRRIETTVSGEDYEKLKFLADLYQTSLASQARRAITIYLDSQRSMIPTGSKDPRSEYGTK